MHNAKQGGAKTQPVLVQPKHHYHCGDIDCNRYIDYNVDLNQGE
jgi:hypothetical protein